MQGFDKPIPCLHQLWMLAGQAHIDVTSLEAGMPRHVLAEGLSR
jgi:hypothetical protein